MVDTWINAEAKGRPNVAPTKIPWDLIRTLITETYGGKIDNEGDFKQLSQLVDQLMTPAAFEVDHELVGSNAENGGDDALVVPEETGMSSYLEWVKRLPEREPPTYLGLPANAEKLLLMGHGEQTIANVKKITDILDEGEQLIEEVEAQR